LRTGTTPRPRSADRHAGAIDRQLAGDYGIQPDRRERDAPRRPIRLRFQVDERIRRPGRPSAGGGTPGAGPRLVTALQEQLGLKLEPRRATVDVMVIDSAEKPAEN